MYRKQFYTYDGARPVPTVIRRYREEDFEDIIGIQRESFPPPVPEEHWWNKDQLHHHVTIFPEGALCVEVEGVVAGSMTGLRVDVDPNPPDHTWEGMTDRGYIRNHKADGNTLYIVDLCVRPAFRRHRLGYWLIQSMYELAVALSVPRVMGGGRMPGYRAYSDKMSAEQYLAKVRSGELMDPVITFMLHSGRTPLRVLANYLQSDHDSCYFAALTEWKNPFIA